MEDDSSERILKHRRRAVLHAASGEVEDDSSERILKLIAPDKAAPLLARSGRRFFRENTETSAAE